MTLKIISTKSVVLPTKMLLLLTLNFVLKPFPHHILIYILINPFPRHILLTLFPPHFNHYVNPFPTAFSLPQSPLIASRLTSKWEWISCDRRKWDQPRGTHLSSTMVGKTTGGREDRPVERRERADSLVGRKTDGCQSGRSRDWRLRRVRGREKRARVSRPREIEIERERVDRGLELFRKEVTKYWLVLN